MPAWRVHYSDGSSYSSDDGPPEDAPATGVQAIVFRDQETGRKKVVHGHGLYDPEKPPQGWGGYYWFTDGEWWAGDLVGFILYLTKPGVKIVKFGETLADDAFRAALTRATHDKDFR